MLNNANLESSSKKVL